MPKPEIETTGTRVVYKNRWMTVREDAILRSNGTAGIYGVVEKADFAVVAAIRDHSIYLVEQYRYPVKGRFWELPQGSWEDRAIHPLELAKAELREETGLVAGSMLHAGRLFLAYGHSSQAYDLYLATDLCEGEAQLDVEEEGLVGRAFPVQVVQTMIEDGTIKDATTVAAFGLLRLKGLL